MKKYLSILLITAMCLSTALTFVGCKKETRKPTSTLKFEEQLTAEQVGSMKRTSFTTSYGGSFYKDSETGLYGVISLDGTHDTGAKYGYCISSGGFFGVSSTTSFALSNLGTVNTIGIINGYGELLVPYNYAAYYQLSDRFIQVYQATERTYSADDAVIFYNNGLFQNSKLSNCEAMYTAKWFVYDIETGKLVPGVTGTNDEYITAKGNFVSFTNDAGERITVDNNGTALDSKAKLFDNGTYAIQGKDGVVYNADGSVLFTYDLTGFCPTNSSGDYYIASKYQDGKSTYVVLDKEGEQVSGEFKDYINLYGNLIHCDGKIYNFKGKNIISGTYSSVQFDYLTEACWILHNDGVYTIINEEGGIVYEAQDDKGGIDVWSTNFSAVKESGDDKYVYCYADQDYTIKGRSFAPWLAIVDDANYISNIVNVISGETLIEGYQSYSVNGLEKNMLYVYAKYDGGTDVYRIMAGEQLATIAEKKASLLDDLIAAFKEAGITVSVNEETGELAMDSSVLFGGDSAELTAEGKAFLNKFIKAYTSIIYSDKYDGFIKKTMVEGHTAPLKNSTYESGLQLSIERATNVKNYCVSSETGVDTSKLAASLEEIGYSNSRPIYGSDGKVNLEASRRVSFRFMIDTEQAY